MATLAMAPLLGTGRTPSRPRLPLFLYTISIILCGLLFYAAAIHCKNERCDTKSAIPRDRYRIVVMYFPVFAAPLIGILSVAWFITNFFYTNSPCALSYNCMEMPCSVFCSLLAGISAVIVIHYSYDYEQQKWAEQWSLAAADAIVLGAVHAVLAFALQ